MQSPRSLASYSAADLYNMTAEHWDAVRARRALLRQQTEYLGRELAWLVEPDLIPAAAVDGAVKPGDTRMAAFSLAGWMLIQIVQAADRVRHKLDWQKALDTYQVASHLRDSVWRAVLNPTSRYAPGIFAIAELVSVIPVVATRAAVLRNEWCGVARRAERFGASLSRNGSYVQVLIRSYLSVRESASVLRGFRSLDPALLRLDGETGISTVTPLDELLAAAAKAVTRHIGPARGVCVALQAPAPEYPDTPDSPTMFGAIWSAYAAAAERLVFPHFDAIATAIPRQAPPDADFALALDHLASRRRDEVAQGASAEAPPAVEQIMRNLLAPARAKDGADTPSTAGGSPPPSVRSAG
jgi:hypothetical protein